MENKGNWKIYHFNHDDQDGLKNLLNNIENTLAYNQFNYSKPEYLSKLIDDAFSIINLSENNPIKIKTKEGIKKSYEYKYKAVEDTQLHIYTSNRIPFIKSLLDYLNINLSSFINLFYFVMQSSFLHEQMHAITPQMMIENAKNNKLPNDLIEIQNKLLIGKINNSEIANILNPHLLKNIPTDWIKNLELCKYYGKDLNGLNSKEQGKFNGPDVLCKDVKTNDFVGIEVLNLVHNSFILKSDKKIANKEAYFMKAIAAGEYKKMLTGKFKDFVYFIRNKILELKKSKIYHDCQRKYLLVQLDSDEIPLGWHEMAEIVLNNNAEIRKEFNKVVLI